MHVLNSMSVTAKTKTVLDTLKKNRELHSRVAQEAIDGFADKAEAALKRRIAEVREGKVRHLTFQLKPPQDHTKVYDTAIQMLELHLETSEEVELDSQQVTTLVMDRWSWSSGFWGSNKAYSGTAQDYADENDY
jgi:arginine utilization protein RocB